MRWLGSFIFNHIIHLCSWADLVKKLFAAFLHFQVDWHKKTHSLSGFIENARHFYYAFAMFVSSVVCDAVTGFVTKDSTSATPSMAAQM